MPHPVRVSRSPSSDQQVLRTGQIAIFLLVVLGLLSCASRTILSGADLTPEEQAQLRGRRGIKFLEIDGQSVSGRWLVLAPGTYDIEYFSAQDAGDVVSALGGVVEELTCDLDLELLPGEEVYVASKMKKGPPRFSGGYSRFGFHTEVTIASSIGGRSSEVDTSRCERRINCRKVDRKQVTPTGCD